MTKRPGKAVGPPQPLTKAQQLARNANEAADVRAYQDNPNVAALRIEKIHAKANFLMWTGLWIGLAFTMTNVQVFAANGADAWTLPWTAAWMLDPIPSLVLVGILYGESQTARYQIDSGLWVRAAKWGALGATYTMNTWSAWQARNPAQILQHSVPPGMVFLAAEAIPQLRDRLTEAVKQASIEAARSTRGVAEIEASAPPVDSTGSTLVAPDRPVSVEVDSAADQPRPIEASVVQPTPTDRVGSSPADRPRPIQGRSAGVRRSRTTAGNHRTSTAPRSRTDKELRIELDAAIEAQRIDPRSAESIRTELRIAPKRARQFRDEYAGSPPDRSLRSVPDRPNPRDADPDAEEADRGVAAS